jgi:hypothetical protein
MKPRVQPSCSSKLRPFEPRTRVGFPSSRYIGMSDNCFNRKTAAQQRQQVFEQAILLSSELGMVITLELDAKRKVIAALTPLPARNASMPCPLETRYKLNYFTVTTNEEMGRNPPIGNALEIRMIPRLESVGEKLHDSVAAILTRWEADGVDDDELGRLIPWASIAIRAWDLPDTRHPSVCADRPGRLT